MARSLFMGFIFDSDKAEIKPESTETLDQIAKYLIDNPKVIVYIVGDTDNSETFEHNQTLSEKRAEVMVQELFKL